MIYDPFQSRLIQTCQLVASALNLLAAQTLPLELTHTKQVMVGYVRIFMLH